MKFTKKLIRQAVGIARVHDPEFVPDLIKLLNNPEVQTKTQKLKLCEMVTL